MSLALLLDEQISPVVAVQVQSQHPAVSIQSIHSWREGCFLGKEDHVLLSACAEAGLTLVTYDQKTIPPVLVGRGLLGQSHAGVVFVDNKTIPSSDIGGLTRALLALWEQCSTWDWTDRMLFLGPTA